MSRARWTMMAVALTAMVALPGTALAKGKRHARHGSAAKVTGTVNLNTATSEQLKSLPGMSQKAVTAIIDYRKAQPFKRVEEIVKVKGFGKKRYEKLKPNLSVTGETRFQVEKAASKSKKSSTPPVAQLSTSKKVAHQHAVKGQGRHSKKPRKTKHARKHAKHIKKKAATKVGV